MKLGLLADIHECVDQMREALRVFQQQKVDQVVVLGDVFELGRRLDETCDLLIEARAAGVWGNHDFGLCGESKEHLQVRYGERAAEFIKCLRPSIEIDGSLFTHVEPWLDPESMTDLWYFDGLPDTPEKAARSFDAAPHRFMFVGHFHRWMISRSGDLLDWKGERPLRLSPGNRYLIAIAALCEGEFATFDTSDYRLVPFTLKRRTWDNDA